MGREFSLDETSQKLFSAFNSHQYSDVVWYRTGIDVGTKDQVRCLSADYLSGSSRPDEDKLIERGWRNIYRRQYPYSLIGSWSDGDRISELRYCSGAWQPTQAGFMWSCFKTAGPVETEFIALPIRWSYMNNESQFYKIVRGHDGRERSLVL